MKTFKIGDRVRFKGLGVACHAQMPWYYPENGTIGIVSIVPNYGDEVCVQWPKDSTSGNDEWWALVECLELVAE